MSFGEDYSDCSTTQYCKLVLDQTEVDRCFLDQQAEDHLLWAEREERDRDVWPKQREYKRRGRHQVFEWTYQGLWSLAN